MGGCGRLTRKRARHILLAEITAKMNQIRRKNYNFGGLCRGIVRRLLFRAGNQEHRLQTRSQAKTPRRMCQDIRARPTEMQQRHCAIVWIPKQSVKMQHDLRRASCSFCHGRARNASNATGRERTRLRSQRRGRWHAAPSHPQPPRSWRGRSPKVHASCRLDYLSENPKIRIDVAAEPWPLCVAFENFEAVGFVRPSSRRRRRRRLFHSQRHQNQYI